MHKLNLQALILEVSVLNVKIQHGSETLLLQLGILFHFIVKVTGVGLSLFVYVFVRTLRYRLNGALDIVVTWTHSELNIESYPTFQLLLLNMLEMFH